MRGTIITLSVVMVMLVSCTLRTSAPIQPSVLATQIKDTTPDWYPLPTVLHYAPPIDVIGYTHFVPTETSEIRLEFDYPKSWVFTEHIDETGIPSIFLGDAQLLDLPTPADDYHPIPNDLGSVYIWIIPSRPGETVESRAETQKQIYRDSWWATFLKDYKVAIDGYGARVIEHHIQLPEVSTSLMFERRIYFFAGDKIYEIIFEIAEKDRGGDFEQAYEYFFDSLQIIE